MSQLKRLPRLEVVTIGTSAGASTAIDMSDMTTGSFQLPGDSGTTQVTVYSRCGSGSWAIAKDSDNGDIIIPATAGQPRPLHIDVFSYTEIKLVASAGTATSDVPVVLKS
jgi:hypothetical protein